MNRSDTDNQLRTAAYEVLNSFITNAANDSLSIVASLSNVILERLEKTIPLQQQVVSVEDRLTVEEMQTSLVSVVMVRICYRIWIIIDHQYRPSYSDLRPRLNPKPIG